MAVSSLFEGSIALTVGIETTIAAATDNGVFQPWFDISQLASGDTLEIRLYEKVIPAGTQRLFLLDTIVGPVTGDQLIWVGPSIVLLHGWAFGLKQTGGVAISVDYSIRQA